MKSEPKAFISAPSASCPPDCAFGKPLAVALLGLALVALVSLHAPGLNGTWYWKWKWDRLEPQWFIPPMFGAYLLHAFGQYLYQRHRRAIAPIILFMAATFSMQIVGRGMEVVPFSLKPMTFLVRNPLSTSYYDDARRLLTEPGRPTVKEWLATFPDQLPEMRPHSKFKPPGLVLGFIGLIKLFGDDNHRAAMIGAFLIAFLSSAGVPAVYGLLRTLLRDREAAFAGAGYFALCPSVIVFFPQLDQVYPALTCLIVTLWWIALKRRSIAAGIGFGLSLALALFLSYVFLVIGVALLGLAIVVMIQLKWRGVRRVAIFGLIVLATIVAAYGLLWLTTGFDPIATYHAIVRLHTQGVEELRRPAYPIHVPFDLAEYAMGFGWIGVMLAGFYFAGARSPRRIGRRRKIVIVGALQLFIVAAVGLWPGETARIWLPLMPLTLIPVALELADWNWRGRAVCYTTLWLLTTILWQNMRFVM